MRSLYVFLLMMAVAAASACSPKEPSYSNINLNRNSGAPESPAPAASPDASATPGEAAPAPPAPPGAAPPATAQPGPLKVPAFFDTQKGVIKDLPSYPDGTPVSVQYGPLSNAEMATIVSETFGSIEKVTQFFDRAIKSNGWTVASETRDTDRYRMNLKKGDKDAGTVQVTRNGESKVITIVVSRTRAL